MSTSCQIQFRVKYAKGYKHRNIYAHWDGYPENKVPMLKEFIKWNKERMYDLEYCAANYIYWAKDRNCEYLTGYGIGLNNKLYDYIDYFYRVTSYCDSEIIIEVYEVHNLPKEKKSIKYYKLLDTIKIKQ